METCKICNEEFKNLKALSTHVNTKHGLSSEEYYDKYMKKKGEGSCVVCGKETTYRGVGIGYLKTCSVKCRNKNKNIKRDYWKGKKQSKEHIKKRVINTNQNTKQKNWEESNVLKYGVTNPSMLNFVKNKIGDSHIGSKKPRTNEWQNKIIESKKINGTLKHSDKTKFKISNRLNQYYSENLDRDKYISQSNNINHLSGWYNGLYFRSSLELSFLVHNQDKIFLSCENSRHKIIYDDNGKQRVYYPDFTDGDIIYEIKPTGLLNTNINKLKIQEGIKIYGNNYKVITEIESPYIKKTLILDLINSNEVILTDRAEVVLAKYKF